ncbi:MAG: DUF72 domain-containing protein [Desulfurococcales archaeon]|nr:DUF72 domain-containing protein [Desulfurococcales archaeon]MCE4605293.1 DUF72 domain-containing protein [Desulfurococcales archaeon]
MGRLVIGTCGFQRARRLYYGNLNGVEVQQTFYDPRVTKILRGWRSEAPVGFSFTMKAWMLVTHKYNKRLWRRLREEVPGDRSRYGFFQNTKEVWWAWEKTLEAAKALEAEVIVMQSPQGFRPTQENMKSLERFLEDADRQGRIIAWEPRGEWWLKVNTLQEIAEKYNILIVGDPLKERTPIGAPAYVRLHGMGGEINYQYSYKDEELEDLARWARSEARTRGSYIMFNNIHAYKDAVRLKALLVE